VGGGEVFFLLQHGVYISHLEAKTKFTGFVGGSLSLVVVPFIQDRSLDSRVVGLVVGPITTLLFPFFSLSRIKWDRFVKL